jgi:hypothetical protein
MCIIRQRNKSLIYQLQVRRNVISVWLSRLENSVACPYLVFFCSERIAAALIMTGQLIVRHVAGFNFEISTSHNTPFWTAPVL